MNEEKKKSKKGLIITIVIVVVLAVAAFFVVKELQKDKTTTKKNTKKTEEKVEETTDAPVEEAEFNPILETSPVADSDYMLKSLIIGDSRVVQIREKDQLNEIHTLVQQPLTLQEVASGQMTHPTTGEITNLEAVINEVHPENIYLMLGTDDLNSYDQAAFTSTYSTIIGIIRQIDSNINIIIVPILPMSAEYSSANIPNGISLTDVNNSLLNLAKEQKVYYLDAYAQLAGEDGMLNTMYDDGDGVTLNNAGAQAFSGYFKTHTQKPAN